MNEAFADIFQTIHTKSRGKYTDFQIQGAISSCIAGCPKNRSWGWPQVLQVLSRQKTVRYNTKAFKPFSQPPKRYRKYGWNITNFGMKAHVDNFLARVASDTPDNITRLTEARRRQLAFAKRQPQVDLTQIGKLPEMDWYERT